jgi:hypothetical protein
MLGAFWSSLRAAHGWRGTLRLLAAIDIVLLCCSGYFFSEPPLPPSPQLPPLGPQLSAKPIPVGGSALLLDILKLHEIRRLCLTIMLMGTGVWVPVVHLLRLAQDRGVSEADSERLLVYQRLHSIRYPSL